MSNCTQVYFVTAAFVPLLAKATASPAKTAGNVINIASISGITKWYVPIGPYNHELIDDFLWYRSQNGQYSYNVGLR